MSAANAPTSCSRRTFLRHTALGALGGTLAATLGPARAVHAAGSEVLKVGLIGCGGRGCGAAVNAMQADPHVRLTALADLFPDQLAAAQRTLQTQVGDQYQVPADQCFLGFDAARQLIATDVDVVLLAETPHYRPAHLKAAVEAGKHIFCEKPIAVDPVGVRSVLATCEEAAQKGLNVVSGLCWRYDLRVRDTVNRVHDGAIGEIAAIHENYLASTLWLRQRQPSWSEMEYQNRNWIYYTWLSGDHIVEQFIHSLDKALWLMKDEPPKSCFGMGGRQVRTAPEYGHTYDHFAVCYEWANGVKAFAYTRQMANCLSETEDYVIGTRGTAQFLTRGRKGLINGQVVNQGPESPGMYDYEHLELFRAIRSGQPINNGRYMSLSTMMAIAGREACYTGQKIDFEAALQADMRLGPDRYEWGDVPVEAVAMPGITTFPRT